jgi:hypothetical protein
VEVGPCLLRRPSVDFGQVLFGNGSATAHPGSPNVLDLMANSAQGDQSNEPLCTGGVLVVPLLVGVERSGAAANFAPVTGPTKRYLPQRIPPGAVKTRRQVRAPLVPGYKLDGQPGRLIRVHSGFSVLMDLAR